MILGFNDYTKQRLDEDVWRFQNYFKFYQSNTYGLNDELDAFRMAYISSYIAYKYGDKVAKKQFEDDLKMNPEYNNETLREASMKIWNARVGREIAKDLKKFTKGKNLNENQIKSMLAYSISEKLYDGKMVTSLTDNKNYDDFDEIYFDKPQSIEQPSDKTLEGGIEQNVMQNDNKQFIDSNTNSQYEYIKTPCVGSYEVSGYTRKDGTEVDDYIRTCGAKHIRKVKKKEENDIHITKNIHNTNILTGEISTSPLEETLRDPILKVLNLKIDSNEKTNWEKSQEYLYKNISKSFLPLASNGVANGMDNMIEARKDKNAIVYENLNQVSNIKIKNKLKSLGVLDDMKGVYYNSNSLVSQKITNMKEIDIFINNLKNGKNKEGLQLTSDKDVFLFLQHVTIFEPKIEKNVFTCKILDLSDFNKRISGNLLKQIPNNWGYNMQEKSYYKNYFIIIDIYKKLK